MTEQRDSQALVISYATPKRAPRVPPRPRWFDRAVIAAAVFTLFGFLIGLPPLAGAVDYTRDIPLSEVLAYGWHMGIRRTVSSGYVGSAAAFVPLAAAGLVSFLYLRGRWSQRAVLAFNIILPLPWLGLRLLGTILYGPAILAKALIGNCDGEDWSEGLVSYCAMGCWFTIWAAVAVVLIVGGIFNAYRDSS